MDKQAPPSLNVLLAPPLTELAVDPAAFWARVDRSSAGCWLWTGYLDDQGYGRFYSRRRTGEPIRVRPHRIAFELAGGQLPNGLEVNHLCRTRACCNPAHMEAITRSDHGRLNGPIKHGISGYRYGCRCDECRDGRRAERHAAMARLAADPAVAPHGRRTTYTYWGCRCDACSDAQRAYAASKAG